MKQSTYYIGLLLTAAIILSIKAKAQPFVQIGVTNNGAKYGAGYIGEGIGVVGSFSFPLTSSEIPQSLTAQLLYQIGDEKNITFLAGVSSNKYTESGKYQGYKNSYKPALGIELGRDWHIGRLFVSGSWNGIVNVGGGMKVIFK